MIYDNNFFLLQAVGLLKDGGVLAYSTCAITPQENEQQRAWALKSFPCLKRGWRGWAISKKTEEIPAERRLPQSGKKITHTA